MSVMFSLPSALRPYAADRNLIPLSERCRTVREALDALGRAYPGVVDRVLTEQGELRPHVNLFVNVDNVRFADGLGTPVRDGDTIEVVQAVSGG